MANSALRRDKRSDASASVTKPHPPPVRQDLSLSVSRKADLLIGFLLVLAVFLVFGQSAGHGFVNFDDGEYVYENPHVRSGISLAGIGWAFTHFHAFNWHPLTTISHMLDCQIFGVWAGGHHLTSVVLHALTAAGLYAVLRQMTRCIARSAFVAFFFAVHPLRAESVAWVAERKNVLSGLFFVLTLAAYLGYVRKPASLVRYLTIPLVFELGLLCKPMLVTLPFVLLLLDYWPLGRFAAGGAPAQQGRGTLVPSGKTRAGWTVVAEKIPLFILSVFPGVITLIGQASAMPDTHTVTLLSRIGNSLVAYAAYLGLFVWPSGLAVYYPYWESGPSAGSLVGSIALLAVFTWLAWRWRRKRPYLIVGWLWYLVMLLPVIGLVQVGFQAMADRYTYLPLIGPSMALVWFVADLAAPSVNRRFAAAVAASLALLVLAGCAFRQTMFWRDSRTLWTRAVRCTADNYVAYHNLGNALSSSGLLAEACAAYENALRIDPAFAEAHYDLAGALVALNGHRVPTVDDEAQWHYEKALELRPKYPKAHINLGLLLVDRGQVAAASDHFQKALDLDPGSALAHNNLGITLMSSARYVEAVRHYRKAIELDPEFPQAHANLGHVLAVLGQSAEAEAELRGFLRAQPDHPVVLGWLAWLLATAPDGTVRSGHQAVELAQKAAQLTNYRDPGILDALAAAYAETNRFQEATETAAAARDLATAGGNTALAAKIQRRSELYRKSQPFRQPPLAPPMCPMPES